MEVPTKPKMGQRRTLHSSFILLLLVPAWYLFKSWVPFARMISGNREVADLGVEILQPGVVAIIYLCVGAVFSTLLTVFIEPQLREGSFGSWSKFGVIWVVVFSGFCCLSAAIL